MLCGHETKTILSVWKSGHSDCVKQFSTREKVTCLAFTHEGMYAVAGTAKGSLLVWETQYGALVAAVSTHFGDVTSLAVDPTGELILSGGKDGLVKVSVMAEMMTDAKPMREIQAHTKPVTKVSFNATAQRVVSSSVDRTVKVWETFTGTSLKNFHLKSEIISHQVTADESTLFVACANKNIYVFKPDESDKAKKVLSGHRTQLTCMQLSLDEAFILAGSDEGSVYIWNAASLELEGEFKEHHTKGAITNIVAI